MAKTDWREALLKRVEPIRDPFRSAEAWADGVVRYRKSAEQQLRSAGIGRDGGWSGEAEHPVGQGGYRTVSRPVQAGNALFRPGIDSPKYTPMSASPRGDIIEYDPPGDDTLPFQTPRPPGFDEEINSSKRWYHTYDPNNPIVYTPGDQEVADAIRREIIQNPVPGLRDRPATEDGVQNDAGLPSFMEDQVQTYLTTDTAGNTVVVNVTRAGEHSLHPGYVAQYIIQTPDGVKVVVAGEGTNPRQWGPGSAIGDFVFNQKVQADLRRAILGTTRPPK